MAHRDGRGARWSIPFRTLPGLARCGTLGRVALRINSNRDGAFLPIEQTRRPDYYRAELSCGSMEATVEFYDMNVPPVATSSTICRRCGAAGMASVGEIQHAKVPASSVKPCVKRSTWVSDRTEIYFVCVRS
jgi:hypothetical protein